MNNREEACELSMVELEIVAGGTKATEVVRISRPEGKGDKMGDGDRASAG